MLMIFPATHTRYYSSTIGYELFNPDKFREVFECFCYAKSIKKFNLKISPPSHDGLWSYSITVKCTSGTFSELSALLDETLENMGIHRINFPEFPKFPKFPEFPKF